MTPSWSHSTPHSHTDTKLKSQYTTQSQGHQVEVTVHHTVTMTPGWSQCCWCHMAMWQQLPCHPWSVMLPPGARKAAATLSPTASMGKISWNFGPSLRKVHSITALCSEQQYNQRYRWSRGDAKCHRCIFWDQSTCSIEHATLQTLAVVL